jgi:hypothetical protein
MDNEEDAPLRQTGINYVDWGIGNVIDGEIYLHKKLKKDEYSKLRQKILLHELNHDPDKKYTIKDMLHDARHTSIDLDLIFFILSTPSSWLQFSPIIYKNKKLILDRQTLYLYGLIIFSVVIGWIVL